MPVNGERGSFGSSFGVWERLRLRSQGAQWRSLLVRRFTLVGRPGGRPRALTANLLKAEVSIPKFRQSEAALKPRPRTQEDKGSS